MQLKKVSTQRLSEIEELSEGEIAFTVVDGAVSIIKLQSPVGELHIILNSYSISVNELATKTTFTLGFFSPLADETVFVERVFDDAVSREEFIQTHLFTIPRDELVLEEVEEVLR